MTTKSHLRPEFVAELPKLEMRWTSEEGLLRAGWSATHPQMWVTSGQLDVAP